jgi:hypothetical protein
VKTWDAVARTWASGAQRHAGAIRVGWNAVARLIEGLAKLLGLSARAAQAVSRLLESVQGRCAKVAAAARYRGQLPPAPSFIEDTAPVETPTPLVTPRPEPAPFLVSVPTPRRSTPPPIPPEIRQQYEATRREPAPLPPPRPAPLPRPRQTPARGQPGSPMRTRMDDPTDPDLTQRTRNPLIPPAVLPPIRRQNTIHGRGRKYSS